MDKTTLLSLVSEQAALGNITESELTAAYQQGMQISSQPSGSWLSKVFYGLGGLIIIVGICTLLANFWMTFNAPTRILLTLGVSIVSYLMAALFSESNYRSLATPFFILFGIFAPIGLNVSFAEAHLFITDTTICLIICSICLLSYRFSYLLYQNTSLIIFSLIYEFFWLISAVAFVRLNLLTTLSGTAYSYACIALGLVDLWRYRQLLNQHKPGLAKFVAFTGSLLVLMPALILRNKQTHLYMLWEILCPFLIIGCFALSARWKERPLVFVGTITAIIYLSCITSDYFSQSFGWPLALVTLGFLIIISVYGAIRFRKKFIG